MRCRPRCWSRSGAPPTLELSWVDGLIAGLREECAAVEAAIVGGDVTAADAVTICVTALGDLDGGDAVTLGGAQPGDVVAVCGRLGWAAAGFAVLGRGFRSPVQVVTAHRRPEPPYSEGPRAAALGATAMTDVSDGLIADLGHIAAASGVRIELRADAIEVPAKLREVGRGAQRRPAGLGADRRRRLRAGGDVPATAPNCLRPGRSSGRSARATASGWTGGAGRSAATSTSADGSGDRSGQDVTVPLSLLSAPFRRVAAVTFVIEPRPYDDADVTRLVAAVQAEYVVRYGGPDSAAVDIADFAPPDRAVPGRAARRGAGRDGRLAAAAPPTRAEIKRMYVVRGHRGRGLSRLLLAELERTAQLAGVRRLVLNTGPVQLEAMQLYTSSGYDPRGAVRALRAATARRCSTAGRWTPAANDRTVSRG